jgi:hypothetical protein
MVADRESTALARELVGKTWIKQVFFFLFNRQYLPDVGEM